MVEYLWNVLWSIFIAVLLSILVGILLSKLPALLSNNEVQKVSIAIDFGTSNCAVAYSTASNKEDVQVIKEWQDGTISHGKVPAAILFDENEEFLAFGNEARDKYGDVLSDGEGDKYYFFQNFKMQLYEEVCKYLNAVSSEWSGISIYF